MSSITTPMTRRRPSRGTQTAVTNREAMTYYQSSHGHNHSVINGIGRPSYTCLTKAALWDDETMADVFVDKAREYITRQKDGPFF